MTPDPATLDRVRALTAHPAFSMTNPNRVRSLIGAFAQGNPTQFNRADGAGYEFVADRILALDPNNPQVASRMTTAFKSWRALEAGRRAPRAGGAAAHRRRRRSCRATSATSCSARLLNPEVAEIPALETVAGFNALKRLRNSRVVQKRRGADFCGDVN